MPDETYDDDLDDESEDDGSNLVRKLRQKEREARKEANRLRQEAEDGLAARRELEFIKAGIDPSDTRMSYFAKGYDGEMTAESIKAAATAAGFLNSPEAPGAADLAEHQRAAAASAGADNPSPGEAKDAEFLAALQGARNQDEALAVIRQYKPPDFVVPFAQ
jgi:hypothetical protein